MLNMRLEVGEGILLQTTDASLYNGSNEMTIDELYLTNKNLICAYKKSNGFFAKSETVVDRIPLSSIAIINGVVQVEQVNDNDYGKTLQIIYTNGRRALLELNPKKQYPIWKNSISDAVLAIHNGMAPSQSVAQVVSPDPEPQKTESEVGATSLFAGFKGVADTFKQSFSGVTQAATETFKVQKSSSPVEVVTPIQTTQPIAPPPVPALDDVVENKPMFCSNCGTKLNAGAKFCHGCGSAVGTPATPPPVAPVEQPQPQNNPNERRQEYVGVILKCPHCGSPITERTVICPDCGMQITGRAAVSSVQTFKDQLMEIESHRKKTFGGMFGVYSTADPADKQKLSLIRNFPIPNTIDDILEFVMLANANIDTNLSKKTFINNNQSSMEVLAMEMPRVISNAWVSKLQQAYQKAEIMFPNDPTFTGIQRIYLDKMKELKIKVK